MQQRRITIYDIEHAIRNATSIEPYAGTRDTKETSSWRLRGPSVDADAIAVGVQVTRSDRGQFVVILTVF